MSRRDEDCCSSRTPGGLKMIGEDRREDVEGFEDPQLAKAMELVGKKKLRAQAEKEEEPRKRRRRNRRKSLKTRG